MKEWELFPPERGNPQEPESLAAEVQGGSDEIGRLPARLDRYAVGKNRALENLAHIPDQLPNFLETASLKASIRECGSYLLFKHYESQGVVRLTNANFCGRHLLCPFCAIRRGAKALRKYLARYKEIISKNPHLSLYMLTVTVKNGPDLAERHDHLKKAVSAVLARRRKAISCPQFGHKTEWEKVHGLVGSYEVTNIGNGWHPHVHCLVLVDQRLDAQLLKDEWLRITGDSHVLRIDPVRHPQEPVRDFLEVFKYAMKFSELTPEQNVHAFLTLQRKRLVFSVGSFRGVVVPEDLAEDSLDDLPFIALFYKFENGHYHLDVNRRLR